MLHQACNAHDVRSRLQRARSGGAPANGRPPTRRDHDPTERRWAIAFVLALTPSSLRAAALSVKASAFVSTPGPFRQEAVARTRGDRLAETVRHGLSARGRDRSSLDRR